MGRPALGQRPRPPVTSREGTRSQLVEDGIVQVLAFLIRDVDKRAPDSWRSSCGKIRMRPKVSSAGATRKR